jgi:hypothetical protein
MHHRFPDKPVAADGTVIAMGDAAVELPLRQTSPIGSNPFGPRLIYARPRHRYDGGFHGDHGSQMTITGKYRHTTAIQKMINNSARDCAM